MLRGQLCCRGTIANVCLQPTLEVTADEFQRVFDVNVKSIFLSVNTVVPQMQKQGDGGAIVNISSIGSVRPRPGLVWYNSSKGAVTNVSLHTNSFDSVADISCRLPRAWQQSMVGTRLE